ncbi:hypothetical protein M569_16831, partial [Genlisea aurea]
MIEQEKQILEQDFYVKYWLKITRAMDSSQITTLSKDEVFYLNAENIGELRESYSDIDAAFIELSEQFQNQLRKSQREFLETDTNLNEDDSILVIKYSERPVEQKLLYSEGQILDEYSQLVWDLPPGRELHNVPTHPGDSGSPVLINGKVFGIHTSSLKYNEEIKDKTLVRIQFLIEKLNGKTVEEISPIVYIKRKFEGRDVPEQILGHLKNSGSVALVAPAGMGKSTCARVYFEKMKIRTSTAWWITAESKSDTIAAMKKILQSDFHVSRKDIEDAEQSDYVQDKKSSKLTTPELFFNEVKAKAPMLCHIVLDNVNRVEDIEYIIGTPHKLINLKSGVMAILSAVYTASIRMLFTDWESAKKYAVHVAHVMQYIEENKLTITSLGDIYTKMGLYYKNVTIYGKESVKWLEKALTMINGLEKNIHKFARLYQIMGSTYQNLGIYEKAIENHEES